MQVGPALQLRETPRPGRDALMWLTGMLLPLQIPSQIFRVTTLPRIPQAHHVAQTSRPHDLPPVTRYLVPLSQLLSLLKGSTSHPMDANRQPPVRSDGSAQDCDLECAPEGLANGSSYTRCETETRSTSHPSAAELEIIESYASRSEGSESRAGSRPTSLNSQYGYVLANEEDYVVEGTSSRGDNEWDECEVSSNED